MDQASEEAAANLRDVKHGIKSGKMVKWGSERAAVQVELLEGETLVVEVEVRGWHVLKNPDNTDEEDWFETLHSLLVAKSPMYKQSFANSIAAKLGALVE